MSTDQKKNILIVDDDPFMQNLYRKTLEREGFGILTADDGLAAVEMLPNLSTDLIILDLMLPKLHGFKVLEAIRVSERHKNLPVLILSNAYLPDAAKKAMKAEPTSGLLKSECTPKRLVKIIREILAKASGGDGARPADLNSWNSSSSESKAGDPAQRQGNDGVVEPETAGTNTTLSEVQAELQQSWPADTAVLREICLKYVKTVGSAEADEHLKNLYRRLRLLSARATIGEYSKVSQLSNALEAMVFEHGFSQKEKMSPSVVQTMVHAVDCLQHLFKTGHIKLVQNSRKTRILLVDDDPVCNMVNDMALKRANFETVCANDGVAALGLLENNSFDLILLDVNMPGLSGFEVCERIRRLPAYKEVPVIFVTLLGDFQSRAQSILSGSNGLIAKPISPLELIVKALVFLLRLQDKKGSKEKPAVGAQAGQPKGEAGFKELKATQTAVEERVNSLTQALAEETKRREEAEQQAIASIQLKHKLQNAQAENQRAHEWVQRMVEESRQQPQSGAAGQASKGDGRTRALESVRDFVENKVKTLTEVLAAQTKRSELAKQKAAEYAKRNGELEASLAEIQKAKENLLREIEGAGNGKLRGELEAALAENQKNQTTLLRKIEATRQEFQIQQQDQAAEQSQKENRTRELQAAQVELAELKKQHASTTEQVQTLTGSLRTETDRRVSAEQQTAEHAARRAELEQELARHTQTQEQLRAQLAEQQQRLEAQIQSHNVELGDLNVRTRELEAAHAALEELKARHTGATEQVQTLSESLKSESGRRASAEQQTAELAARRTELESELAQRTQKLEQLSQQLAEQQQRLEAQVQAHNAELGGLTERTKELEAAQAELAELRKQLASATEQVRTLTESLKSESDRRANAEQQAAEQTARRTELEQELARRTETQEQLRAQLAEQQQRLDAQVQAHNAELGDLTERTKQLQAAQAELAELKVQHASVTEQVQTLTESLKSESDRRATAEQQATEQTARRTELEQELARRTETQEQLRAQLAEQQQRLETQVQAHNAELGDLTERTKDLQSAQTALTELTARHASVTEQVQTLTESLKTESGRRESAEQQAAGLEARRTELERELAQRTETQEQLRAQLVEQQQRLEAQVQTHNAELGGLTERTKELQSAQTALAELKAQHASVTEQVQTLTESLKTESNRRASAEQQATEQTARRAELEQELGQRGQVQEQLRAQLAEQQQRLEAQVQAHNAGLGDLTERTKELQSTQKALAELKAQHASVTEQVQTLTESLKTESDRRASAEQQTAELTARRAELEQELAQRGQVQEQLRAQLTEQQQRLEAQIRTQSAELSDLTERTKQLQAAQAELADLKTQHANVTGQVRTLTESLKFESGRRESAERQSAELATRRSELEQELAQRAQTQDQLRTQLSDQQQQLEARIQAHNSDLGELTAQTRELETARAALAELKTQHASVTEQVQTAAELLKSESGRRENAERQSAELAARRAELEQELVRHTQTQEQLRAQLAEGQQRLEVQVQAHNVKLGDLMERTKQLQAAETALAELKAQHASVTQQVQTLTGALQAESSHRASAEQQAAELVTRRTELEQELAQRARIQEQLRTQLAEQQQRLNDAATEVESLRSRVSAEALRQQQMAGQMLESEQARAELSSQLKSARELTATREAAIHVFETELEQRRAEHQRLDQLLRAEMALRRRLDSQIESVQSQLDETTGQLSRKCADEKAWLVRESELQGRIRQQQDELAASNSTVAAQNGELKTAREKIEELQVIQSALSTQVQALNQNVQALTESLKSETGRRETAEQQVAELASRRTQLEQDLAQGAKTQDQLRAQLTEQRQKLEAQVQAYNCELGNLAVRTKELETAQAALAELRTQHAGEVEKVRSLAESLAAGSSRHTAAERAWVVRESELQGCVRNQQDDLAKSSAALAARAAEIKTAREKIEELQILQSALCGKVKDLNRQGELTAKVIEDLKAKADRSENAVETGQRKLAELRYAILDASRMSARLHRERSLKERQNLDALRQLLSSLAQTPLSLAQRGLLAELQASMDGLKGTRAGTTKIAAYPVELPGLRDSQFSFAEVTGTAFRAVQAAAEAAGVAVQTVASGTAAGKLVGDADHVYQLIVLLAVSPLTIMTGITALDVRAAVKSKSAGLVEMTLRVALSTDNSAPDLLERLTSVTAAAASLQTDSLGEAELGLAAGWQLAQAMGATTSLQVEGGKDACLLLSLPFEMDPPASRTEGDVASLPAFNGHHNGNGHQNGNGYHNGNGNGNCHQNGNSGDGELVSHVEI